MAELPDFSRIRYERAPPRATIWLDRPAVRNAMDRTMAEELRAAVIAASRDPEIRVIVYRGTGEDFCAGSDLAGLDVEALGAFDTSFDPLTENGFPHTFSGVLGVRNDAIPKVTIAAVQGYAVGGGFEIFLEADLGIVTEDAVLGDCHIQRGVLGGGGVLWNVARMAGMRRMKDLIFTGRTISGREAYDWGLASRLVAPGALDAALDEYVGALAALSPRVQRLAKIAYGRSMDGDRETLEALEALVLLGALNTGDAEEGISAFREKRAPEWRA